MTVDLTVKCFLRLLIQTGIGRNMDILNTSAVTAVKMVVRLCIGIKMIGAIAAADLTDLSNGCQKRKIPVYGPQTDVGKFFLYIDINSVGSGMIRSGHQEAFDRFTLSAVF